MESVGALLQRRSSDNPDVVAYTFRAGLGDIRESMTYGQLDRRARGFAAHLGSFTTPGERVLLLYPSGIDYVVAFFGCIYTGAVPVPAYPPTGFKPSSAIRRLMDLARDAGARIAVTTEAIADLRDATTALEGAPWHVVPTDLTDAPDLEPFRSDRDDLAMLQYTSGSTGTPKGVMITHANLLSNMAVMAAACGTEPGTTFASWLPLYHDMGLIAGVLQPVLVAGTQHLMSPVTFLRRPLTWLEAISAERASISVAPGFAFEHCLRRITAADADSLDLSCWTIAATGAESIRPETLRRFSRAFARCGFRPEAMYPCYGLAEATCAVTGGNTAAVPATARVDRDALQTNRVKPTDAEVDGPELVGCGWPYLDHAVAIVSEDGVVCDEDQVGEIWVTGSSVASGYWGKPDASRQVFDARLPHDDRRWVRTGDLGFQRGGELFVVGRLKDLIIVRGRNHAPEDIEATVAGCSATVQPDGVVAFGLDRGDEERLVLVVALARGASATVDLGRQITRHISESHGLTVDEIVFVKSSEIPRTSSGKVQRRACRDAYLRGVLADRGRRQGSEPQPTGS